MKQKRMSKRSLLKLLTSEIFQIKKDQIYSIAESIYDRYGVWLGVTKGMRRDEMFYQLYEEAKKKGLLNEVISSIISLIEEEIKEYKESAETCKEDDPETAEEFNQYVAKLNELVDSLKREMTVKPTRKAIELRHDDVVEMISVIGQMMGFHVETSYAHERFVYDVVWKRIKKGSPSHAFEVQIGGNLSEALTRLKHAHDVWNAKPVLVTVEKDVEKAKDILRGSFHEIADKTVVMRVEEVKELYEGKKHIAHLEKKLIGD
ncbi:MAG: hypothetical protein QXO16_00025 [Archaeoglobaceae archaeon]